MPPTIPPTVRQRRLIASLRGERERSGLTSSQAAAQLGFSQAKMSRIESGHSRPKARDVVRMLELYGTQSPQRDALIKLASEADRRGWWTAYDDVFAGSFAALEDEARAITAWEGLLVPGLLQTTDYARAVISRLHSDASPAEVHRRVVARANRALILQRPEPPRLTAYIGEAVVRQQIGGPDVMARQIQVLLEHAARPHITLQLVPFEADAHPGLEGPVVLFSFADDNDGDTADLDVAHAEGLGGPVYLESAGDIERIRVAFAALAGAAMSPSETSTFLAALVK